MTEQRARELLSEIVDDFDGNEIDNAGAPFIWDRAGEIVLDGSFTYEQVIAIAWWLENKGGGV